MDRLTDEELEVLLGSLESDLVERKQSFSGEVTKTARQAVCAFANDLPGHNKPGVLCIGVNDNGDLSHLEITDGLLRNLADIKTDGNILPMPVLFVERRLFKGVPIAVVTVLPSDSPPVKYQGRIWVRTGPRRSIANQQEERILNEKRRYKDRPFDIFPMPTAKTTDLSRLVFESEYLHSAFSADVLEANGRSYEERLSSCKMIQSPSETTPTVLGVLTLGKTPQDFLPGAYIQFLKIDGLNLEDFVVDEEPMMGSLREVLHRAQEKFDAHNRVSVDVVSEAVHTKHSLYPRAAIFQILYNAVFHRTYESNAPIRFYWFRDRIEITSPGGPYGNVTVENFGQPGITDYRNPNIGSALKIFGFIQSFGRGIAIANVELAKNGNPPIEFNVTTSHVLATIRIAH